MASPAHCLYCFEVLAANLENRKPLSLAKIEELYRQDQRKSTPTVTNGFTNGHAAANGHAETAKPLFVTWNNISDPGSKSLRGCIGTFEPQPLESGLGSYALTSALDDTRFDPIALKELPALECSVTLLTDFESADSPTSWDLGVHGLRISFVYHGKRMGATYLPDVPKEQGWTKEETLISLMRKAGWTGKKDGWGKVELTVITYKGKKESISWGEYRRIVVGGGGHGEEEGGDV